MNKIETFKYIWWINLIAGIIYFVLIQNNSIFSLLKIFIMILWLIIGFLPFYPPFRKYIGAVT